MAGGKLTDKAIKNAKAGERLAISLMAEAFNCG